MNDTGDTGDTGDTTAADNPGPELGSSRVRITRLFKNSSIYALGELGLSLLSVLMMPILTMFLLPAEYGLFSLAMMLFTGFTHLCNPALHGSVTRFYFDHEHDEVGKRRFQGTILSFLLAWSFGMCVIATVTGPSLFPLLFVDLPFWPYGVMTVWMVFLGVLGVVPKATWVASENSKPFVGVSLLGSAVNVLGTLSLVALAGLGVMGMFLGRAASLIVLAVPFTVYSVRHLKLAWSWDDLRSALRFSLPLVPHLIAHWVLGMSDRFIIEHHYPGLDAGASAAAVAEMGVTPDENGELNLGLAAVGIYSAAYDFMNAVNMVAVSMNNAWVPQFTRAHGRPEERPFVARSITYFMLAVGSMSAAMVVLSPTIVRSGLINSKYAFAAEIAPILALGGLFQGLYYVYVAVLFYYKQNRLIPVITVVSGVTNVVLNLLWLPSYGLVGAAWATVVGYTILVVGVRWAARRCEMPDFEVGRLARIAGVLLVVVAAGMLVDGRLWVWWELLVKLGILGLGALALWSLGVVSPRDREAG
ncbi:lipopolysaccharide biosynthesis protein [Enhygromyxa salina]|uniref:Polysaccharide biosynthesis protein n=1 Tax=Enhygromyxa salina TaxID=215803 RepID=A0A2S9XPT3_9BACT|nr:oligosaccharide flippase family protein [Enhygromyxa salina]PRP94873.1 Polysaccharide biosynthesis protein [Enhygromyxa salina]